MTTILPIGTYIQFRWRGQRRFGQIVGTEEQKGYIFFPHDGGPPIGSTVHRVVWKPGDVLETRGMFTMTKGKEK